MVLEQRAISSRTTVIIFWDVNMEPKRANNVLCLISEFYMDTQEKNKKTYLCTDLSLLERNAPYNHYEVLSWPTAALGMFLWWGICIAHKIQIYLAGFNEKRFTFQLNYISANLVLNWFQNQFDFFSNYNKWNPFNLLDLTA